MIALPEITANPTATGDERHAPNQGSSVLRAPVPLDVPSGRPSGPDDLHASVVRANAGRSSNGTVLVCAVANVFYLLLDLGRHGNRHLLHGRFRNRGQAGPFTAPAEYPGRLHR